MSDKETQQGHREFRFELTIPGENTLFASYRMLPLTPKMAAHWDEYVKDVESEVREQFEEFMATAMATLAKPGGAKQD